MLIFGIKLGFNRNNKLIRGVAVHNERLKIKLWHTAGPLEKILLNKRTFCKRSTIIYDMIDYGVTVDLQKKSLIEPTKSCPHWLKITRNMQGVRSPSPGIQDCCFKNIFPSMLSNTSLDFILDMEVTDQIHYDW